jgi:hypothetical protein
MRPLPPPPLRLKTSPKAGPAQAAGQLTRTLEIKKGKTTLNSDAPRIDDIPVAGDPAETAIVGLSLLVCEHHTRLLRSRKRRARGDVGSCGASARTTTRSGASFSSSRARPMRVGGWAWNGGSTRKRTSCARRSRDER